MPLPENLTNRVETSYSVNRTTMHFPGIIQVPVQGARGTACKFIRIHAPYEVEVVTWVATAEAGAPKIPSPFSSTVTTGLNSNLVFLGSRIGLPIPVQIGGGTPGHAWSVSGVYYYGAKTASTPVRNYSLGRYPWETDTPVDENYLSSDSFIQGILDTTVPTAISTLTNPVERPGN